MLDQFKDLVKFSIKLELNNGKKKALGLPKEWNKIDKSIINDNYYNYAIRMGKINNVTVIDIDKKEAEFLEKDFEMTSDYEFFVNDIENLKTQISELNSSIEILLKHK